METPPEDPHTHDDSSGSVQPPTFPQSLLKYFPPLPGDLKGGMYRLMTLETVWMYYLQRDSDQNLMDLFKELKKILNQTVPRGKTFFSALFLLGTGPPVVYSHVKGDALGADRELLTKINSSKKLFKETEDWQECDIIFLFCLVSSRLGADVTAAMNEVSEYGDKKIILVLMYHTHKANHSTSEKKWSAEFPNIKLQVPVLFHETVGGLLNCEKNTRAMRQIEDAFTQKHSTEMDTDAAPNQKSGCKMQ